MSDKEVDRGKRRFLIAATAAMGGVATIGAAVPFVMSMTPSQRAKAAGAPVEVNIGLVEPGMLLTAEWRGKPVWIINRTKDMLDLLGKHDNLLVDPKSEVPQQPEYCKNEYRSIKPQYWVCVGICTHLGCSPTYRKDVAAPDIGSYWPGGFLCPCHGSRFDLAGRVFQGSPAPTNLVIPPYKYLSDSRILIGEDTKKGA
jgi:ubiquinol-cytochrome c reductase iron-sulfur subunit